MTDSHDRIYIGTILLEINRHRGAKMPTFRVSEWLDRFAAAGFDGVELWENHAALAPEEELADLASSPVPIAIYNGYATFWDGSAGPAASTRLSARVGARAIKFNFTRDASHSEEDIRGVADWRAALPAGTAALCECHPGTIAETPGQAAAIFGRLGRDRYEAIVHPLTRPEGLREWFRALGPMITHAHLQARGDDGQPVRLDRDPRLLRDTIRLLREEGFCGSYTLEFTEGMNRPGENIADLWQNALRDLAFLREALA